MDREFIRRHLPEEPPKGMLGWAVRNLSSELGEEYMIFKGVRARRAPTLEEVMENDSNGESVWAAECLCTNCQESFLTEKIPGIDGFRVAVGEDEETYPCFYDYEAGTVVEVGEGDEIFCPNCGERCRAVAAKHIRGGRTKQVRVCSLDNVEGYTAILYWLVWKRVDENGVWYDADPEKALVITEHYGLVGYTHRTPGGMGMTSRGRAWVMQSRAIDPWYSLYHDWGSIQNRKVGAVVYSQELPNMDGATGEKTGLLTWFQREMELPVSYFRAWKRHRNLEQLVLSGCEELVLKIMEGGPDAGLGLQLDFSKQKPHQILGISKGAFRFLKERDQLNARNLVLWQRYQDKGKGTDLHFFELNDSAGGYSMDIALDLFDQYGDEPEKVFAYLGKQGLRPQEAGLLRDSRRFAQELRPGQALTAEELWPRHLQQTHDRLAQLRQLAISKEEAEKWKKGFDAVIEKYGDLQWNDKRLAVILPKNNSDLVQEGKTLRHCVGGYGNAHSKGKSIILFVRHYRRPERSYYTLNISFTGPEPREVQLHGYGNERHGPYKEHSHSIPKSVREFVDRWEREILLPWWREQQKKEKERKTV